jgi:hypothetical protein
MDKMDDQSKSDLLTAISIALMVIFIAWGNALAMLIISILGLGAMLVFFRKLYSGIGALPATFGFALSVGISLVMMFR